MLQGVEWKPVLLEVSSYFYLKKSCCSSNDAGQRAKLEKRLYSLIHVNVVRKAGPIFQPAGACHKTLWEIDWKYNRSTIVNRAELENYFVQNRFPSIPRESGSFPKYAL